MRTTKGLAYSIQRITNATARLSTTRSTSSNVATKKRKIISYENMDLLQDGLSRNWKYLIFFHCVCKLWTWSIVTMNIFPDRIHWEDIVCSDARRINIQSIFGHLSEDTLGKNLHTKVSMQTKIRSHPNMGRRQYDKVNFC
jgi:hypothetical protein